jgi:Zn-dependent M28 family amino/carboxypeptidase
MMRISRRGVLGTLVLVLTGVGDAESEPLSPSEKFRAAVTLEGVRDHQRALQAIADESGGNRAAGTVGYDRSVEYVAAALTRAGYAVTRQPFEFPFFEELTPPRLAQVAPASVSYPPNDPAGVFTLTYSPSGNVAGRVQGVDLVIPAAPEPNTSTSGCEPEDFASFVPGNVALVQRGTCAFSVKAENAEAAGASAVLVFNEGQPERSEAFGATLVDPSLTIPVVMISYSAGVELAGSTAADVELAVDTRSEFRSTENVLADSRCGAPAHTVVVGAHLDSVPEGPGINDNGSGSAVVLEIAEQLAKLPCQGPHAAVQSRVRFAFWGAEELGLLGAEHYVSSLPAEQLAEIALNLNFDMLGSPNFVRFVYDGDGSDTELVGPPGSEQIEAFFLDHFAALGLPAAPTAFDGRSDYGPFIERGIPAGGLFSGAEALKTEAEAALFGGTAGLAHDPCYHQACDTVDNVSEPILDELADAAAAAVLSFASKAVPIAPVPLEMAASVALRAGSGGGARFDRHGPELLR